MARSGGSFMLRPVGGRTVADTTTAAALELQSVSDFADGIGNWDAGTVVTSLPGQPPAAITAALHGTSSWARDGTVSAIPSIASSVFRIRGWCYNADNANDLKVGIQTEDSSSVTTDTNTLVAAAAAAGWVYFDVTVTAPADAVTWRPEIRSANASGHDWYVANIRWSHWSIRTISSDWKDVKLEGLFNANLLSVGDFFSFEYGSSPTRYAFHQVTQPATVGGLGRTDTFEVVPPLRSGAVTTTQVKLIDPTLKAIIEPGSVNEGREIGMHREGISFRWMQTLR